MYNMQFLRLLFMMAFTDNLHDSVLWTLTRVKSP